MEFPGHRHTADDTAPHQHPHLQNGRRQMHRTRQPIVSGTENQDIVMQSAHRRSSLADAGKEIQSN